MFLIRAVLIAAAFTLLSNALSFGQAAQVIVNDSFNANGRTSGNASSAGPLPWFSPQPSLTTYATGALSTFTGGTTAGGVATTFAPATPKLTNVGDKVVLSYTFQIPLNSSATGGPYPPRDISVGLRVGLFNSNGTPIHADGGSSPNSFGTTSAVGFAAMVNVAPTTGTNVISIQQRSPTSGDLLSNTTSIGNGGGTGQLFATGQTYTGTLAIQITAPNTETITATYSGGALPNPYQASTTVSVPSDQFLSFDTIGARAGTSGPTPAIGGIIFSNISVTFTPGASFLPVVLQQPDHQVVAPGSAATFRIVVNEPPGISYQWLANGVPLVDGNGIFGAKTATLDISSATSAAAYSVVVSTPSGSVTSSVARLTVIGAPPPLPIIPSAIFKVSSFGAIGDGSTDNTSAIQNAINTAQAAGGGTVELPAAPLSYLCGPIKIGSNINLQIDAGAVLQALPFGSGAGSSGTYPKASTGFQNFISVSGTDVEMSGSGRIDGQGAAWWAAFNANNSVQRPQLVFFSRCNFVLIKDVTVSNAPAFHIVFVQTSNVTIDGITINTPTTTQIAPNTDGIDPGGSHYLIQNCNITDGDDCISIKGGPQPCSDITIKNCTLGGTYGLAIGSDTNSGIDGVLFKDCKIIGDAAGINAHTGIYFKSDPLRGGLVQNITFDNITMVNVASPIQLFSYFYTSFLPVTPQVVLAWNITPPSKNVFDGSAVDYKNYNTSTMPTWKNITISNMTVSGPQQGNSSTIWGLPNNHIANLTLTNVNISNSNRFQIYNADNVQFLGNTTISSPLTVHNAQVITGAPQNQTVAVGTSASFKVSVAATAGDGGTITPSYRWYLNGRQLSDGTRIDGAKIGGSATDTLIIDNAQSSLMGSYVASVTHNLDTFNGQLVRNGAPVTAMSGAALLTVYPVGGTSQSPVFTTQPLSEVVISGSTAVFNAPANGAAVYQWQHNGVTIAGATTSTLAISNAGAADTGSYIATAINGTGSTASTAATLSLTGSTADAGRLINLSILTPLVAGETMTMGAVLGGAGTSGAKPLLSRAAGPALAQLGVIGVLPNPRMTLNNTSGAAPVIVATNTGWDGDAALSTAFAAVGAFPFASATSKDSAIFRPSLPSGSYTVQVSDANGAAGTVIAELYDSTPAGAFTASTPRLINVSALKNIATGSSLTVGFVIGGTTSKTVLIRAIGPTLGGAPFNLQGVLAAPRLTLVQTGTSPGATLATNSAWGGDPQISSVATRVGAFAVANPASNDAMLLLTLAPGNYSAQVAPTNGTDGGTAIVEVYEVP